jgi:hypothetical protein
VIDIDEKMRMSYKLERMEGYLKFYKTCGKQSLRRKKRNPWIDEDTKKYGFTPTPYKCNNLELSKDIKVAHHI